MQEHEYSLLGGINRAKIGRYLGLLAASVSASIVFILLSLVDVARSFGIPANLTPTVLSLVGSGTVFGVLYWLFDRYMWRWQLFAGLLNVPNLDGIWQCAGTALNPDGFSNLSWNGEITIIQSWDKIRVRLKTNQSGSNSVSAALICDRVDGYKLLYSYKNDPHIDEPELNSHHGFSELIFSKDLLSAEGSYFNGHGRFTFGTMRLSRNS